MELPYCQMTIVSATGVVPLSVVVDELHVGAASWMDYVSLDWGDGIGAFSPTFATSHTFTTTGSYIAKLVVQNTLSGSTVTGACYLLLEAGVTCGNNIQETGESCDDGNLVSGDGCSAMCQKEGCLDPIAYNYDASAEISDASCASCGDGIHQPEYGEQCDDGNTSNNDLCLNTCKDANIVIKSRNRGSSIRQYYVSISPDSIPADLDPIEVHNAKAAGEDVPERSFIFKPQSLDTSATNLVAEAIVTWSPLKRRIFFNLSEMFVAAKIHAVSKDTSLTTKERITEIVKLKNLLSKVRLIKLQM
ncbi:MAG: DUF4215 domain-containing protein [Candidatus Peribacteria bacterium]|nr:MAG: DUF4215 domain-containing protein [Candidatus Peribacteria bacterium]